jgi:predicted Fe-S protein YdhL (DUF1289 family)
MIESPCIKVCTLDATGELCLGCFRTIEEIGGWAAMCDAERSTVIARLAPRREDYEARSAGE